MCLKDTLFRSFFLSAWIDSKRNAAEAGNAIQRPGGTPHDLNFDRIDEIQRFQLFMDSLQNMLRTRAAGASEGQSDRANPIIIQVDAIDQSEIDDIETDFRIHDVHQFFFQFFLMVACLTSVRDALFQTAAPSFIIYPQTGCG